MPERNPFTPEEEIVPPSENVNETKNPSENDEEKLAPSNIEDCQTEEEVTTISEAKQREAFDRKTERTDKLAVVWEKAKNNSPKIESLILEAYNAKKQEIDDEYEAAISENGRKVKEWYAAQTEVESKKLHEEIEGI